MRKRRTSGNIYTPPEDRNIPIWRYMTFGRYIDLLSSSTLFFCRADKFIDEFEGRSNAYTDAYIDQLFTGIKNANEMRDQIRFLLKETKNRTFVNCWHMNYAESLQMWDAYCPQAEGVVIKSKFDNLLHAVDDPDLGGIHIQPVIYARHIEEEINLANFVNLLNYKRPQFKFENELRIALFYSRNVDEPRNKNNTIIKAPESGIKLRVDIFKLIDEIYVSPKAPEWFYELVVKLTRLTFRKPVLRSTLR